MRAAVAASIGIERHDALHRLIHARSKRRKLFGCQRVSDDHEPVPVENTDRPIDLRRVEYFHATDTVVFVEMGSKFLDVPLSLSSRFGSC